MLKNIYRLSTILIGHSSKFDKLFNNFSDQKINIHPSVEIGRNTQIFGNVDIESDVSISWNCTLHGSIDIGRGTNVNGRNTFTGDISIGKYCAIAPRARIRTDDHPTHHPGIQVDFYDKIGANMSIKDSGGPVDIGNDVWICADAKITSGVTIGDGAVIAANAVVADDVEPYSLVAGNPAKHKKYRFDTKTRNDLLELEWWEWNDEKISKNIEFFESDLRQIEDIHSLITEV